LKYGRLSGMVLPIRAAYLRLVHIVSP